MKVKNITKVKLCQRTSKVQIVKDENEVYVKSPDTLYKISKYFLEGSTHESFIAFALSTKNEVLAVREIFRGSINTSVVHPREVFQFAILNNASAIAVCHNHPSGQSMPSSEDKAVTDRLKEGGELLGIELIDHLIYGDNEYFSFAEHGLL